MKKAAIVILLSSLLFSCASLKMISIKGNYPPTPIVATSERSFDKVWESIVDYFAQNGIPIKLIDKSSGLIVSDKARLSWSFEDKNGKITNPQAYAVLPEFMNKYDEKPLKPEYVTGEWNVRVKTVPGGTYINVNLYNIEATYGKEYYSAYTNAAIMPVLVQGRTTGIFENLVYQSVK